MTTGFAVEDARVREVNANLLLDEAAFLAAWKAFQDTPIDLVADSDDEQCRCIGNAIKAYLAAARERGYRLTQCLTQMADELERLQRDLAEARAEATRLRAYNEGLAKISAQRDAEIERLQRIFRRETDLVVDLRNVIADIATALGCEPDNVLMRIERLRADRAALIAAALPFAGHAPIRDILAKVVRPEDMVRIDEQSTRQQEG